MSKPPLKILPPESKEKVLAPITFMRAGLERMEQDGLLNLDTCHYPSSEYHEEFIEHTVTIHFRFRTEYRSEEAKEICKDIMVQEGKT